MNTEHHTIGGIAVEVHWKNIKNLHVGVYPPDGRVRVAAPTAVSLDAVRRAVLTRMAWVRRQQARFLAQERQSARLYQSGETHYVWGRPLRLEVVEWDNRDHKISVLGNDHLVMNIPSNSSRDQRARWMAAWRRAELRMVSAPKVQKWSAVLGLKPSKWGIRDMRTKWGSCNADKGIIWLNTELSAKPANATDYVILHELAHLISDRHDDQFVSVLDQYMPQWRTIRADLNLFPLAAWDDYTIRKVDKQMRSKQKVMPMNHLSIANTDKSNSMNEYIDACIKSGYPSVICKRRTKHADVDVMFDLADSFSLSPYEARSTEILHAVSKIVEKHTTLKGGDNVSLFGIHIKNLDIPVAEALSAELHDYYIGLVNSVNTQWA